MKKNFLIGAIAAAALTAISVILLTPQNGEDLKEEIEVEAEHLKEKFLHEEEK